MAAAERLFRILELIEARGVVAPDELQGALEVSRATLKRDLVFLRDRLNAPIVFDRDAGGYRYSKPGAGPRFQLLSIRHGHLVKALGRLIDVMERCEPDVDWERRASDDEWIGNAIVCGPHERRVQCSKCKKVSECQMSEFKVGDNVHYHPIIGEPHNGKVYRIRTIDRIPSSPAPVAWLDGKSGCVCMEALSAAPCDVSRCPHGVRSPHPCRECEDAAPQAAVDRFRAQVEADIAMSRGEKP